MYIKYVQGSIQMNMSIKTRTEQEKSQTKWGKQRYKHQVCVNTKSVLTELLGDEHERE